MITDEKSLSLITELIIGCAYRVAAKLGHGFLEKCYENALAHEMRRVGLIVEQQHRLVVWYDDLIVGEYVADLIVNNSVLVELKAISGIEKAHIAQCINYLTATKMPIYLLINFGKRVEVKRLAGSSLVKTSV